MDTDGRFERLTDGIVELTVATAYGPRVVGFSLAGGTNVFAELGNLGIDLPDGRTYTLRGGHRLWVAPEVPELTYVPDDHPVAVESSPGRISLQATDNGETGIDKTIEMSVDAGIVTVTHTLRNRLAEVIGVAPWAITQLQPGGTAILPLPLDPVDQYGLQPNSSVVLWPYTGTADNPFVMKDRLLLLDAARRTQTKVGIALHRGWLAYSRDGLVFVKRSSHQPDGRYLDMGASGQCYSNPDFLELESLGEQTQLAQGESVTHIETWELHSIDPRTPPHEIPGLLDLDGGRPS